jgi:hypothetical protein
MVRIVNILFMLLIHVQSTKVSVTILDRIQNKDEVISPTERLNYGPFIMKLTSPKIKEL